MKKIIITGGNGFIGTNLILSLREKFDENNVGVYIIDIKPPKIDLEENERWINLDILHKEGILQTFDKIKPDFVIHLAAETSCDPTFNISNYLTNTEGSKNVFTACEETNVDFLVHTSTQYVNQSDNIPRHDTDYAPHTVYGESKIISEVNLREGNYNFNWVIIRPTNVWGRWHLRYPYEFWKVLRNGKYYHPGHKVVKRSYGYVGNVCEQILKLIDLRNSSNVAKKVFYVGDEPLDLFDWVNSFSLAITKKPVRVVPRGIVFTAALVGSFLQKMKIGFPITISRYNSMTSHNPAPMENTIKLLGVPKYSIDEGVAVTTKWLNDFWKQNNI